jgi:RNA polymerase sigma factor (sigma-70 family)
MPTRRTVRKERALALQPQAKRLFVMRGYPPNGRKGRSSDPPAPSKAEDWQGTAWHDRLLRIYYQDIGTIPRLRPEEERELACDLQQPLVLEKRSLGIAEGGDDKSPPTRSAPIASAHARELMVTANLRLVVSIAKQFANYGMPLLDLIQEGNLGLMRAVEKFDPTKGYRFSTYANWWIRASIARAMSEQGFTIRVPSYLTEITGRVRRAYEHLQRAQERAPTPAEVASAIGLPTQRVRRILEMNQQAISLDDRGRHDPSAALPAAFERQPLSPTLFSPVEAALRQDLSEGLQQLFTRLTPRERQVITLRFGLDGDGEHSCQEIGQQLQLSRERIRQIAHTAIEKLRGGVGM